MFTKYLRVLGEDSRSAGTMEPLERTSTGHGHHSYASLVPVVYKHTVFPVVIYYSQA